MGSDGVTNSIDSCLETLEVWRLNNSISSYLIIYLKSLTLPKALTRAWRNRRLSFVDFVLPWGVWSVYWRAGFVNHSERERERPGTMCWLPISRLEIPLAVSRASRVRLYFNYLTIQISDSITGRSGQVHWHLDSTAENSSYSDEACHQLQFSAPHFTRMTSGSS